MAVRSKGLSPISNGRSRARSVSITFWSAAKAMSDISPSPVMPASVWRRTITWYETAFSGSDGPVRPISRVENTDMSSMSVIFISRSGRQNRRGFPTAYTLS